MARWRARHRGSSPERGAAAVEFAIVFVLLIFIIFSLIDFGRLYFTVQGVKSASREGARTAAVKSTNTATLSAISSAANSATSLAGDGNGANVTVDLCLLTQAQLDAGGYCSDTQPAAAGPPAVANFTTASFTGNTSAPTAPTPSTPASCAVTNAEAVKVTVTADFKWFTPVLPLLGIVIGPANVPTVTQSSIMRCE